MLMRDDQSVPIRYVEPVFRPPSEANSLILPVTDGCSWNKCTFCELYTAPQKKFRARDEAEVIESIRRTGDRLGDRVRRVFLADGDALVLPIRRLLTILAAIRKHMPAVERVSSYCLPRNLRRKTVTELAELRAAGLELAYVGAESGDDTVLARVNKGETFESTREALDKLGEAGIARSVMILNGLGGRIFSGQHADHSARLANAVQPEYLATLVVSFPMGEARFRAGFPEWEPLDQAGLFCEMERFLAALERRKARREVPQRRRLLDDAPAVQLAGAAGDVGADLDDVVDVALGVGAARHGEAHEVERRGPLGAVGPTAEHHRADLAAADAAGEVELDGQRLAGVARAGTCGSSARASMYTAWPPAGAPSGCRRRTAPRRGKPWSAPGNAGSRAARPPEPLRDRVQVAAGEPAVGREALGEDQHVAAARGELAVAHGQPAADVRQPVFLGAHGHAVGQRSHVAHDIDHRRLPPGPARARG
jgi:plasmid stability protein